MSAARHIADFILAYALASLITVPFAAILHGEVVGADYLVIAALVITAGIVGLQMQLDAIDENLRLTTYIDPGYAGIP